VLRATRAIVPAAAVALAIALSGCRGTAPSSPSGGVPGRQHSAGELDRLRSDAKAALDAKDYRGAASLADQALRIDPEDTEIQGMRGLAQLGLGNIEQAVTDLCAACKSDPDSSDIQIGLAEAYDRANNPESAEPHAALAAKLLADDPWAYYASGKLLMELGRYAEAAEALQNADDMEEGDPQILLALAEAELMSAQAELAAGTAWHLIDALTETTESAEPPSSDQADAKAAAYEIIARAELANTSRSRELSVELARQYLESIKGVVPDKALAACHIARAWRQAGKVDGALFALKDITPPPDVAWAQAEVAEVLLACGKGFDKAAIAAGRAAELDPSSHEYLGLKGWAEFKTKDYGAARTDLAAALALARTKAQKAVINYRLFRACEALQDPAAALSYRQRAQELGYQE